MSMNERIRELMEQAGLYDFVIESMGITEEMEKFAQLIVQECIDIIAPYSVRMIKPGEEYLHPIQEIKEHFGVEDVGS
jgi:uncharacterized protein YutE (UPF0331/DUF86 family)